MFRHNFTESDTVIIHNIPTSPSRFGVSMDTENGQMSIVNTGEHPDPHMNIATPGWTSRPVVDIGGST